MKEFNFFKVIFSANLVIVFFLLMLLLLIPSHTMMAWIYAWFFTGFCFFFLLDLVLFDFPYSELVDTITVEENNEKYPLQIAGLSVEHCVVVAIVGGLLLSGFYSYGILVSHQVFMPVPNLFSAPLVPFTSVVSGQLVDVIETSFMVAVVEESVWTGLLMPVLWSLLFVGLVKVSGGNTQAAFLVALVIACLLTGVIVPYVYHAFAYGGNLFAYANAQLHFTLSAFLAGATGTTIGGIIAHAIHNTVAKLSLQAGTFSVATPLGAYIATPPQ